MITERLMKPGQFDVKLKPGTPFVIRSAFQIFDHIVVTPTRAFPIAQLADAEVLASAIYTGVITDLPTNRTIQGQGLAFWLGTDEGIGDVLDTAVTQSAANLGTWITALRPASLAAGTVTSPAGTVSWSYQYMTRREAIDAICNYFGAEWKITPDGKLSAAIPATLHPGYTTPVVVITGEQEGDEGNVPSGFGGAVYYGLQSANAAVKTAASGYSTKVIVVGQTGDGAALVLGTATGATTYKDLFNNSLIMERLVNSPVASAAAAGTVATNTLNLFSGVRKSVSLSSQTYLATRKIEPGDNVWAYNLDEGLYDLNNQIRFRGDVIAPAKLRCYAVTYPIIKGMGVYLRQSGATATYTDLSDYVDWEDGDTTWEVGAGASDPSELPTTLGGAYLGDNRDIVQRAYDTPLIGYTPTFGNVTGAAGVFKYSFLGPKTLWVAGYFTGGTATALGTVTVSIPGTGTAGINQVVSGIAFISTTTAAISSGSLGSITIWASSAGANFAAGAGLNTVGYSGVVHIQ